MDLPRQYSYNPGWRLILFTTSTGILWLAVERFSWGHMPRGFGLWFGIVPIMLGLLGSIRRLAFDRRLLLDRDELVLPTGFLHLRTARIAYVNIERAWRVYLPGTAVLRLATKDRRFGIPSVVLPDSKSYLAVEEFLISKARENASGSKESRLPD